MMSKKSLESFRMLKLKLKDIHKQNDRTGNRLDYHEPRIHSLGYLEQVESYYNGNYYDGPNSYYWYD